MRQAKLRKPVERSIAEGHPWVYRAALEPFDARPGEVVTVVDRRGRFVGRGIADSGPIAVRVWTSRDEPVDAALLGRRLRRAAELRDRVIPPETDAWRLVHGEGDRMPGVVVDVYAQHAVLRLDGEGAGRWKDALVEQLDQLLTERGIETLLLKTGRRGEARVESVRGTPPDGPVEVREHGMRLHVDLLRGQKTGLFLDHRESRARLRPLARGQRVLNLYGYTGGFSVAAGLGGAVAVRTVDAAAGAIELADRSWRANGLDPAHHEGIVDDVPDFLRRLETGGGALAPYDVVVTDPPSFAPNEQAVPSALASYRALHASVFGMLPPGGLHLLASCSSHVGWPALEGTVREAARKARRVVQVLDRWGAPADHPRLLAFPEGDYLKVLLTRVVA